MATVLTLEQLDSFIADEASVREVTNVRNANLRNAQEGNIVLLHGDEETGRDGTARGVKAIAASYRGILRDAKSPYNGDVLVQTGHYDGSHVVILRPTP